MQVKDAKPGEIIEVIDRVDLSQTGRMFRVLEVIGDGARCEKNFRLGEVTIDSGLSCEIVDEAYLVEMRRDSPYDYFNDGRPVPAKVQPEHWTLAELIEESGKLW